MKTIIPLCLFMSLLIAQETPWPSLNMMGGELKDEVITALPTADDGLLILSNTTSYGPASQMAYTPDVEAHQHLG